MLISKAVLVLLLILNLVLIVPAQYPNKFAINRNNVQQLQSFVLQNLENTLQDMNNIMSGLTGNPAVQRISIINSNHQPQNNQNPWSNIFYPTIIPNFGNNQLNIPSLNNFPNMQLSIGTMDSRPPNPGYDNSLKNQSFKSSPSHTTTPINTFAPEYGAPEYAAPEYATPEPVVNEENNGNIKINDNDQDYDIDVRHQ